MNTTQTEIYAGYLTNTAAELYERPASTCTPRVTWHKCAQCNRLLVPTHRQICQLCAEGDLLDDTKPPRKPQT